VAVTERSQAAARAVDDLYRQHGGEVYRYALAVLGNHADAEDVTQTTFLNAYRAIEQGVEPRKPGNWLLTIASNAIKQRFRQENARPRQVVLDRELADASTDGEGPTVGELLTALSRIPPQQRQAIVLREFEGRSYTEIAAILGVTTSALETLLFRARRSLAEELEHHLTCTEAQAAVSRATDGRLGRKERRRLREHLGECPDCASFARAQQRHRKALRGLVLMPVPLSLTLLEGFESTAATAAVLPVPAAATSAAAGSAAAGALGTGVGAGTGGVAAAGAGATGGGLFAGGVAVKAAAVVTAASVAGGVGVVGASEIEPGRSDRAPAAKVTRGERLGQTAPRGVLVPGQGVAKGKAAAPGQTTATSKRPEHATRNATSGNPTAQRAKGQAGATGQDRAQNRRPANGSTSRATLPRRDAGAAGSKSSTAQGSQRAAPRSGTSSTAKRAKPPASDRGRSSEGASSRPATAEG